MTDNHPITPPPEMVEQWHNEAMLKGFRNKGSYYGHELAIQAARWGADQELEACLRLVEIDAGEDAYDFARYIRAARRPKPPSLKEQALKALDEALFMADDVPPEGICSDQVDIIRRALEQLDD
jgi:hypothetical protein